MHNPSQERVCERTKQCANTQPLNALRKREMIRLLPKISRHLGQAQISTPLIGPIASRAIAWHEDIWCDARPDGGTGGDCWSLFVRGGVPLHAAQLNQQPEAASVAKNILL